MPRYDDEERNDEPLRHMTAVSAFMTGVVTVSTEGDCEQREVPVDFDNTDTGTARIQEARTVRSFSFPFCNPIRVRVCERW